ncbi:MAG: hypothetical protein FWG13_05535 [Leptospirales bacterium]|nr:hypothetical protein [Leptospirales bacterium]
MQLKYLVATLIISMITVITGCASNQCIPCMQSQLIEEYYVKPTEGSDAERLDTLEQEIIVANNRKAELVKKDHIIDLRTKVAEEELTLQQDRTPLLKANLDLAVGKNDDELVKKAEADLKANQCEVENKQCIIDYLKLRKEVNQDEIAMTDAELAAKLAEREYIRAKIARVNQDAQLRKIGASKEDDEKINVEEYEDAMKARQKEERTARKKFAQNDAGLKATPPCGFDEEDLKTPPVRQQQQEQEQSGEQPKQEQQQEQQNQQQQSQQSQQSQQQQQVSSQPAQQQAQSSVETQKNDSVQQVQASRPKQEKDTQSSVITAMEQGKSMSQPCPCDVPQVN